MAKGQDKREREKCGGGFLIWRWSGEEGRRDPISLLNVSSFFSKEKAVPTPSLRSSLEAEVGVGGERPGTEKGGEEKPMPAVMSEEHLGGRGPEMA